MQPLRILLPLGLLACLAVSGRAQSVFAVPPIAFEKEPGVRLDLNASDPPGTVGLNYPHVIRLQDGSWRMYYTTSDTAIASAHSSDGLSWTKDPGVRFSAASLGVTSVVSPQVFRTDGSGLRMYFRTWSPGVTFHMRSATSTDGLNWVQEGVRFSNTQSFAVVKVGTGYRVYYNATSVPVNSPLPVSSAVSANGLTWTAEAGTRHPGTRQMTANALDDGSIVMCYTANYNTIESARSFDGLNFTTDGGVRMSPGGHPDSIHEIGSIMVTSLVQFPDGRVRAYYQGSSTANILSPARVFSALVDLRHAESALGCLPATTWTKESGPRLALGAGDPGGTTSLLMPCLVPFPDGVLRMYYTAYPTSNVMSAVSPDGMKWTKEAGVRLSSTTVGLSIQSAFVLPVSGGYRMYFETAAGDGVYSVFSTNGLTWAPEAGVRLSGGSFHYPKVLALPGGGFRMYFWNLAGDTLSSAFSLDGLAWSNEGVRLASVVHPAVGQMQDGTVVVAYTDINSQIVRSARSSNGLSFVVDAGTRLTPGGADGTGASGRLGPSMLYQAYDGTVRLYYTASPTTSIGTSGQIYTANLCASEVVADRGIITAASGGIRRLSLIGDPGKAFIIAGSMSGPSGHLSGCGAQTLLMDDYYRMSRLAGDPLMDGSKGRFGPDGRSAAVFEAPPGYFAVGESIWHAVLTCLTPPPPPPPLPGKPPTMAGSLASNASSPIRLTVK